MSNMGKVALVTGASSGIGLAVAERLLDDGFRLYVAARSVDKMAGLVARGAVAIAMDITKEADVSAAVERIAADVGGVDLLVNNAGFGLYGPVEEISIDEARYQFEVNVFGLARLTQLLIPAMRARGSGTIVNVTSMGGKIYSHLGAWYHGTKHALEGWSDCLRLELAPFGIDVVIVEPGVIETGFGTVAARQIAERSGNGPYAGQAAAVVAAIDGTYGHGTGSDPKVIAHIVSRAARARRPRTRYVAGKYAKMLIGMRRWMSDRMFDRLIMSQTK